MKYLTAFILAVMLLPQLSFAATELSTKETQLHQLYALKSYLERTYHLGAHEPLTDAELQKSIEDGVSWLMEAQEEGGHLAYEYVPYEDRYRKDDNIVRQAGALYELGEVLRRQETPDPELAEAIESLISYFEDLAREDTFLKITFKCIVEDEESDRCKLGASSLALIGILSYVEVYPEKEDQYGDLIGNLVTHIINAKRIHGTFRESHYVGKNEQPSKESPFADGEAVLALVRYHNLHPSMTVRSIINSSIEELMKREYDTSLYLWIMAALKDLEWLDQSHIDYAQDFTGWRVNRVLPHKHTVKNYCAYSEGLASALSVLKDEIDASKYDAWRTELDYWNIHNTRLQISASDLFRFQSDDDGELELLTIADMDLAEGGFLTSHEVLTQRIDFTQHCVSAALQTLVDLDEAKI